MVAVASAVAASAETVEAVVGVEDVESLVGVGSTTVGVAVAAIAGAGEGVKVSVLSRGGSLAIEVGNEVASSVIPDSAAGWVGLTGTAFVAHPRRSISRRMIRRTIVTINLNRS